MTILPGSSLSPAVPPRSRTEINSEPSTKAWLSAARGYMKSSEGSADALHDQSVFAHGVPGPSVSPPIMRVQKCRTARREAYFTLCGMALDVTGYESAPPNDRARMGGGILTPCGSAWSAPTPRICLGVALLV